MKKPLKRKSKKNTKRVTLEDVLKKELKDPEFSFFFKKEKVISEIAYLVRNTRQRLGLTQTELAKRAKTNQSVIARLESGSDRRTPSLELLDRIARALKTRLLIGFESQLAA